MLLILSTILFLYIIYKWITIRPPNFPPGPPYLPFAGSAPFVPRKHIHFAMKKWRYKYGPVVGLLLGPLPAIAVCDPLFVLDVQRREEFQGRPDDELRRERCFNKRLGIVFNEGPLWVEQRRFTFRHLKDFGFGRTSMEGIILEEIDDLLVEIKDKTMQVNGLFGLPVVNMLWHLMAGTRYEHNDPELVGLLNGLQAIFRGTSPVGIVLRNIFPFIKYITPKLLDGEFLHVNKKLQSFMMKTVQEHKETLLHNKPRDFIDVYLMEMLKHSNESSSFTEEGLVVLCMDIFTAGAESVSNTLGFILMYMILYPDVQKELQNVIDDVIGKNRKPSLQDRTKLPFVEAVLLEVQRINSIAPLSIPRRVLTNTELYGYTIPKDTLVFSSLWSLLHDEEHWKDPENFRPSRFLDAEGTVIQDKWFLPFSLGKRACPGDSLARNALFLFFTSLLQKFTITLPPGASKPSTLSLAGLTTSPQPFEVIFVSR